MTHKTIDVHPVGSSPMHCVEPNEKRPQACAMSRRDFVRRATLTTAAGVAAITAGRATAQTPPDSPPLRSRPATGGGGLLYPQQNPVRNVLDMSGLWQFQLDPKEEGEAKGWFKALPAPRPIAVPCSWNDLFDDARDYLGLAWYRHEVYVPSGWRGQRVFLRVGSANYAAKVWVNGTLVAEHLGGHLPFVADVTDRLAWDRPNVIAITVENKQLLERVPPGPGPGGGGVAGVLGGYPATTYDFFPYAGLHRPVAALLGPGRRAHRRRHGRHDDRRQGRHRQGHGRGRAASTPARGRRGSATSRPSWTFRAGSAEATLRVPAARFWGPRDPHLYPLTVTLTDGRASHRLLHARRRHPHRRGPRGPAAAQRAADQAHRVRQARGLPAQRPRAEPADVGPRLRAAQVGRRQLLPHVALPVRGRGDAARRPARRAGDQRDSRRRPELRGPGGRDRRSVSRSAGSSSASSIARDKNHPSTIMWNVANEPMGGPLLGGARPCPRPSRPGCEFFREMYEEARRLDATRPVTLVGVQGGPTEWHGLFDVVCVNRYYGWYSLGGRLERGGEGAGARAGRAAQGVRQADHHHRVRHRHAARRAQPAAGDVDGGVPGRIPARLPRRRGAAAVRGGDARLELRRLQDRPGHQPGGRDEPQGRVHPRPAAQDGRALPALAVGQRVKLVGSHP